MESSKTSIIILLLPITTRQLLLVTLLRPKTALGVSGTNIKISQSPDSDIAVKDGKYLHIVAIQGLGSGSDVMSGDFSFAASGYLMNGHDIEQVVKEVTISGNYYDIMVNNIELVGDKEYGTYDNIFFFTPNSF